MDFVQLLRRHQASSHRFLHQVAANGKELSQWYKEYTQKAAAQFRRHDSNDETGQNAEGAGMLTEELSKLVSELSTSDRDAVENEINAHSAHLDAISAKSASRMNADIAADSKGPDSTASQTSYTAGPGIYLARWTSLINATTITPLTMESGLRSGGDASVRNASGLESTGAKDVPDTEKEELERPPKCSTTTRLLLPRFKKILQKRMGP